MNIFFLSLGCDKNLCDSEHMLWSLSREGYDFTDVEEDADIIIVNTCAFIGDAQEESINEILRLSAYKQEGRLKALIACGCLAERFQNEIMEELPELDAVVGISAWDSIGDVIREVLDGRKSRCFTDKNRLIEGEGRIVTTGGYYAYLKIAEGCDKFCTYCIIPSIRGRYRSVPEEVLIREAGRLAESGVKELILVAQETTLYGTDLYHKKMLPDLLEKLSSIDGIEWIRLLYSYPEEITEELLDTMAALPKVVHYLDLPVQHASDRILSAMNRRTNKKEFLEKISMIRKKLPDIALRTTLITGFPGETESDFEELLDFVKEVRFDRLGAFTYSQEEGTPAAEYDCQTEDSLKEERRDAVMSLQQEIVFEDSEKLVGKIMDCMVEGRLTEEDGVYAARTYRDAPDVDGLIFIDSDLELMSGQIVRCRVTGTEGYDLTGEIIENESAE